MTNPRAIIRTTTCALVLAAAGAPTLAQDSGWTFDVSANLWTNDTTITTDTPEGEVDATLSFSDAIKDLQFAFMGTVEARNGPWSVIGDLLYFKLLGYGLHADGDAVLRGRGRQQDHGGQRHRRLSRLLPTQGSPWTLAAASGPSRQTSIRISRAPPRRTKSFSNNQSFIDPIVAARVRMAFNDQWFGTSDGRRRRAGRQQHLAGARDGGGIA